MTTYPRDVKFNSDPPIFNRSYHIEFKLRFVFITIQKEKKDHIGKIQFEKIIDMNITLTGKKHVKLLRVSKTKRYKI